MFLVSHLILPLFLLQHTQRSRSTRADKGTLEPVTDLTCWLYRFVNLTCNYTLPEGYTEDTIGIVTYRNSQNNKPPKLCYNGTDRHFPVDEAATLDELQFQAELLDEKRNISRISRWFDYNPDNASIPDEVTNLRVNSVTSTGLELSWQQPGDWKKYTFKVRVTATWEDGEKIVNAHQTNTSSLTLDNLVPGTAYILTVQCRAYRYRGTELIGHWSYPEAITIKTEDDVPGAAPRLAPAVSRPTDTQLIIYWQSLKPRYHHGQLGGYIVELDSHLYQRRVKVGANQTSLTLNVSVSSQPVRVRVYAVNRKGASNPSVLLVTPPRSEPSTPVYWVTGSDGSSYITYHWGNTTSKGANCVLYWCRALQDNRCQGQIEWKSVTCDKRTAAVDTKVMKVSMLIVGLSVELSTPGGTARSRIKWQQCIYTKHKQVPLPPEEFRLSQFQPPFGAHLMWKSPACDGRPYISHYILSYCGVNVDGRYCTDGTRSINISNLATSYVVQYLRLGTYYNFTISAVSQGIEGPSSTPVTHLVAGEFDNTYIFIIAVIAGVLLIWLAIFLVIRCRRKCTCAGLKIQIPKMQENEFRDIEMDALNERVPTPPPRRRVNVNGNIPVGVGIFPVNDVMNCERRASQTDSLLAAGNSHMSDSSPASIRNMPVFKESDCSQGQRRISEYIKMAVDDTQRVQHPGYTSTTGVEMDVQHPGYTSTTGVEMDVQHPGYTRTTGVEMDVQHHGYTSSTGVETDVQHPGYTRTTGVEMDVQHHGYTSSTGVETDVQHPGYTSSTGVEMDVQHHGYTRTTGVEMDVQHPGYTSSTGVEMDVQHHGYTRTTGVETDVQHPGYTSSTGVEMDVQHHGYTSSTGVEMDVRHPGCTGTLGRETDVQHPSYTTVDILDAQHSNFPIRYVMKEHHKDVPEGFSSLSPENRLHLEVSSDTLVPTVHEDALGQNVEYDCNSELPTRDNGSCRPSGDQSLSTTQHQEISADQLEELFESVTDCKYVLPTSEDGSREASGSLSSSTSQQQGISGYSQMTLGEPGGVQHPEYTSQVMAMGTQHISPPHLATKNKPQT